MNQCWAKIPRRNEETLVSLLGKAQQEADKIHTRGWSPEFSASDVIDLLKEVELIFYKPEGEFKKPLSEYEGDRVNVLKSALSSAGARHIAEVNSSIVRDADNAMSLLRAYIGQAKLEDKFNGFCY